MVSSNGLRKAGVDGKEMITMVIYFFCLKESVGEPCNESCLRDMKTDI